MRFVDEATIHLAAGHGGPGAVSFRREKFVPKGGPDGGDGGRGGSIYLIADPERSTLQDFRYKRIYKGQSGLHGQGGNKNGKAGDDIEIPVPAGTIVRNAVTHEILFDLCEPNQRVLVCKGGRGGKGNSHFATSTHQAPKFSQPGEPGETLELKLELKLLADVGLIGLPNAGKSTLISRISRSKPKIADYPFTTLIPNLGVVSLGDYKSIVVADIPGLIKGASKGAGLGIQFLRHIERTRLLIHLIDGTDFAGRSESEITSKDLFREIAKNTLHRYLEIRNELTQYATTEKNDLAERPELIVITKSDTIPLEFHPLIARQFRNLLEEYHTPPLHTESPLLVSAVSGINKDSGLLTLLKIFRSIFGQPSQKMGPYPSGLTTSEETLSQDAGA